MKLSTNSNIDGIIFDLDGVLANSKGWHERALKQALSDFGYEVNLDDCYNGGLSTKMLLANLSEHGKCPTNLQDVWDRKQKIAAKLINKECRKNQRVYDVVKFARDITEGKVGLATNCSKDTAHLILEKLGIDIFFNAVVTSGDVTKPKPHPIVYLEAVWELGLIPSRCLAIDDSDIGIASALEAGCRLMRLNNFEDLTIESVEKTLKSLEILI